MGKENRRSPRVESHLPVTLLLRDNSSGRNLAEPQSGCLENMSVHGVCLNVPHIRIDRYHLFYTFADNTKQTIYLEVRLPDLSIPPICIPARPVWFDHLLSEPTHPFAIGMEFLLDPDDEQIIRLRDMLTRNERQEPWWRRLFHPQDS